MDKTIFPDGVNGLPLGGDTGQVLAKKTAADNDTEWVDQSSGSTNMLQRVDTGALELPRNAAGDMIISNNGSGIVRVTSAAHKLISTDLVDTQADNDTRHNSTDRGITIISDDVFDIPSLPFQQSDTGSWRCPGNTYIAADQKNGLFGVIHSIFVPSSVINSSSRKITRAAAASLMVGGFSMYTYAGFFLCHATSGAYLGSSLNGVRLYASDLRIYGSDSGACLGICRADYVPFANGIIPNMTSNTAPSGVASTRLPPYYTTAAWHAFTWEGGGVGWLADGYGVPDWLQYQFTTGKTVKRYYIIPWSTDSWPERVITAWHLDGSNDGSNWTVLDTRSVPYTVFTRYTHTFFSFSNSTAYTHYRLVITANQGNNAYVGIRKLDLYET